VIYNKLYERFFWLSLIIIFLFGGYCNGISLRDEDPTTRDKYLAVFKEAYHNVRLMYPDRKKANRKNLFMGALSGMFEALGDPHSIFLDARTLAYLESQVIGSFGGLGFSIMNRDNEIIILYTLPNTPARRADIRSRDRIIEINGKPINKLSLSKIMKKLRGKPSSPIKLTILRGRSKQRIEKALSREIISAKEVDTHIFEGGIGYIRLRQFSNFAAIFVKEELIKLKNKKVKGLIFDLRGNPGGSLHSCLYIINYFLDGEKKLVYIKGSKDKPGQFHKSNNNNVVFPNVPLVVLANEGSASASEIFVGAIQDHNRGIVIGNKTYGKGSVQTYTASSSGMNVGYKVTIAKWYTPNGRAINGVGLEPNIKIKSPDYTLDDKYYIYKLLKIKLIENYVEDHPNLTKDEIREFIKLARKEGIKLKKSILVYLLKSEKYMYEPDIVTDMSYDKVLKAGWENLVKRIKITNK